MLSFDSLERIYREVEAILARKDEDRHKFIEGHEFEYEFEMEKLEIGKETTKVIVPYKVDDPIHVYPTVLLTEVLKKRKDFFNTLKGGELQKIVFNAFNLIKKDIISCQINESRYKVMVDHGNRKIWIDLDVHNRNIFEMDAAEFWNLLTLNSGIAEKFE